jgi:hypothetical protein
MEKVPEIILAYDSYYSLYTTTKLMARHFSCNSSEGTFPKRRNPQATLAITRFSPKPFWKRKNSIYPRPM